MVIVAQLLSLKLEAAGIPIFGVSIPDAANKATWRIDFRPEATAQQMADAQTIVANLNTNTTAMQYIRAHYDNRIIFAKALYQLELGIDAHTVGGDALTSLRTALTNCANVIATLSPAFTTHVQKVRDLYGVGGVIGSMTLANCRTLQQITREWLNSRIAVAMQAEEVLE